jgi:hypothetical protein
MRLAVVPTIRAFDLSDCRTAPSIVRERCGDEYERGRALLGAVENMDVIAFLRRPGRNDGYVEVRHFSIRS